MDPEPESDDAPPAEGSLGWSLVARPFGTLLLVGGVLGGVGAITSGYLRREQPDYTSPTIRLVGWTTIMVVVAAVGLIQFRKVDFPQKLVSGQTLGVWALIGLACVLTQVIGWILYLGPYTLIPVTSMLIGVGIGTLAFQTRHWVLVPCLTFFAASLLLASYPQFSREILGGLLITAVGGLGLAIRLGASLEPATSPPAEPPPGP